MVVVLFLAIGLRIQQYGVTEQRYIVVLFGIWLVLMALYYLFSKKKNLKVMMWTMFVAIFLTIFGGPLSAIGVSVNSQMWRLEEMLTENGILVDGKVQKLDKEALDAIQDVKGQSIVDEVRYLIEIKGPMVFQPLFNESLKKVGYDFTAENGPYYSEYTAISDILNLMGLGGRKFCEGKGCGFGGAKERDLSGGLEMSYSAVRDEHGICITNCILDVKGYDYFLLDGYWSTEDGSKYAQREFNESLKDADYLISGLGEFIYVHSKNERPDGNWFTPEPVKIDWKGLLNNLAVKDEDLMYVLGESGATSAYSTFPVEEMRIQFENDSIVGYMQIKHINVVLSDDGKVDKIRDAKFDLYWSEK
jgi:hypothetical protein